MEEIVSNELNKMVVSEVVGEHIKEERLWMKQQLEEKNYDKTKAASLAMATSCFGIGFLDKIIIFSRNIKVPIIELPSFSFADGMFALGIFFLVPYLSIRWYERFQKRRGKK